MDAEAMILNPKIKLETVIAQYKNPSMIFGQGRADSCEHCCTHQLTTDVSAASFLVKNTPEIVNLLLRALHVDVPAVAVDEGKEAGWCESDAMTDGGRPVFTDQCQLALAVTPMDMHHIKCYKGTVQCYGGNLTKHEECNQAGGGVYLFQTPAAHDFSDAHLVYTAWRCNELAANYPQILSSELVTEVCSNRLRACAQGEWYCRWFRDTHSGQELAKLGIGQWANGGWN
jgi:hypothetical protein